MTTFPNFLDAFTLSRLQTLPLEENPHHRALLDVFVEVQDLEQQLLRALTNPSTMGAEPAGQLDACSDLLLERLAAGYELSVLLSAGCCCEASAPTDKESGPCGAEQPMDECCQKAAEEPLGLVDACLNVFAELGDPNAVASADMVDVLRRLPGIAENRCPYADLTQMRLARLLTPYGIRTHYTDLPDGRRLRAYRRSDLLAAQGGISHC
ncbi:DUF3631 domain-containing protein [Streptomyces sp. NPDC093225]|uniref:DUF3631 domain-containing protein n=1 Tax=Streptomyces sp. NPDC093225 TaxID=3366034 RepID=UPI003804EA4E